MSNSEDITVLHRKRGNLKASLTRFSSFLSDIKTSEPSKGKLTELELRIGKLETHLLADFEEIQLQIENIEESSFDITETENFEASYFAVLSDAKNVLSDLSKCLNTSNSDIVDLQSVTHNTSGNSNNNFNPGVRLPTIELPKFDGVYERWAEFRDLFTSLIHENDQIKPVSKFHYLRASLQGCAAQCIKSIEFSAENYQLAWDILNERFNNKRLMVHNHLKSIFSIHEVKSESATSLRNLVDTLAKNLRSLKTLGLPTDHWDVLIIFIIVNKLDPGTVRDWEDYKLKCELPTLEEFTVFLKSRADFLEKIDLHKPKAKFRETNKAFVANSKGISCFICKKNHTIYNCLDFAKMSPTDRQEKVRQLKLCDNCLRNNHQSNDCKSGTCRKCNEMHHTLLHLEQSTPKSHQVDSEPKQTRDKPSEATKTYHSYAVSKQILLSTALVDVVDAHGNKHSCRALLDCGSMSNYISEKLFSKLGLNATKVNFSVTGIGQLACNLDSACHVEISSNHSAFNTKLRCLIISKITDNLPNFYFDQSSLNIPDLQLADPKFNEPGEVELLIGAGVFWDILCKGKIVLGNNKPVMYNTKLGWIVSGSLNMDNSNCNHRSTCTFSKSNANVEDQIAKFWEIEEIPSKRCYSQEELQAEEHFVNNFKRDQSGRFIVAVPLKKSITELGDSRQLALKRFYQLEGKLSLNPKLKQMYTDFMREYIDLSHMTEYDDTDDKITYFSPHHGVFKEDSCTTKLRVVFNSSAPSTTGVSYNNLQMVGPTIQDDLIVILLRFRQHEFVVSADIAKMYRQILVGDEFKPLQLILWRSGPDDQLRTYSLNTVTYGTASASFLATRCLKQLAIDHKETFPLASNAICRDFYVDDLLTGANTVEETVELCQQISSILESGCLNLRKWKSNNSAVIHGIQSSISSEDILHIGPEDDAKILGMFWSCKDDTFLFQVDNTEHKSKSVTKRVILSETARIFDPLGLISPCVVVAKILMQKLWTLKLSWDDEIPPTLASSWSQLRSELNELGPLAIPRHVLRSNPILVELHGFADASQDAYGCCIYLRSKDASGHVTVRLLCAKSRVAPLKSITIPRLELCSACMLAKLYDRVKTSMNLSFDNYYLWSDSTITLCWIRTSPHMLQTFVANRVASIQQLTEPEKWRHVPTEHNPSDLLSRGSLPKNLINCSVWFNGPNFLQEEPVNWPVDISLTKPVSSSEMPEVRSSTQALVQKEHESFPFERFSSLTRLKRITAFILRFLNNTRKPKEERLSGKRSLQEIDQAFIRLVRISQQENFPMEILDLSKNNSVNAKSSILNLTPFLDEFHVLRVGGRLKHSPYSFQKKHPAVLSSKHRLTYLILKYEHIKLLHSGPQLLLAAVREIIWPVAGKNLAKRVIRECVVCCRHRPRFVSPIMGNLPASRVTPSPPFYNTGVDYAGPFTLKDRKGRGCKRIKCYLCLFVCLATKAVHLELVSDLSTPSFLETLQRFISRRGRPSHVYSDNGSNLVGANSQLKELGNFLSSQSETLSESIEGEFNITWHFIPAYSPHMGGIWEAGVKSAKYHIRRVLSNTLLTFEAFYTVLTQIESILNSRPLTPLSADPNDLEILTPAHFLIGRSYMSIPEPDLRDIPTNRLSQYQHIQQLKQHFWARWSKEYISQLQARVKWKSVHRNIEVGSIVIVKDDNLPPSKWCIGSIQELHPGSDHVVRVVSVKTGSGTIKRSVGKICVLPVDVT